MAHGGARAGAGRKPGAATKLNQDARQRALDGGISPLDYMLGLMRDEGLDRSTRLDAAKSAAPYVHARLAAVEHSGGVVLAHEDALDELDDQGKGDQAPSEG